MPRSILITGATGYLGRPLTRSPWRAGMRFARSSGRAPNRAWPAGAEVVSGDPFSTDQLAAALSPGDTLVHLIGTPRPSPAKAQQFLRRRSRVDPRGGRRGAARAGIAHIVYVSVAHPAPVMHAYIDARTQGEALVRATGIPATILRPWYVLGPGHWWPYALLPFYRLFERIPSKRESALRFGLVTHQQMITALMRAIEDGPGRRRCERGVRDPRRERSDVVGLHGDQRTNVRSRGRTASAAHTSRIRDSWSWHTRRPTRSSAFTVTTL